METERRSQEMQARANALAAENERVFRELQDKRRNWRPIPIAHEYAPRDPACRFCDDPPDHERHQTGTVIVSE